MKDKKEQRFRLTEWQKTELNRRYADHQNGIGKTYTWDETVSIAKQALAEQRFQGQAAEQIELANHINKILTEDRVLLERLAQ
jgi:hypothetical protein